MKTIAIIATGGTIAGKGKNSHYYAGNFEVEELIKTIPQVKQLARLRMIQMFNVDSNDIDSSRWLEIREQCHKLEADPEVDGIVITHGTDTLEETAFFLDCTLNCRKPVVLTGSMRPATATSPDGPMNLYEAIVLACSEQAYEKGVLAVFSDTIYSGRDIYKINSYKTDAFRGDEFGALGFMRDESIYMRNIPNKPHTYQSVFAKLAIEELPKVPIYYAHVDNDPDLLDYLLHHYEGVVIAGTGAGNYSNPVKQVIEHYEGDCMVVRSSRVQDGAVFSDSVFDTMGKTIPAIRLSAQKASILLRLSLLYTDDRIVVRELFEEY